MNPISLVIIMILLTGAATAQLAPDKERFDVELHPGEVVEKTLTLTNTGDKTVYSIKTTPVAGSAKDFILLDLPDLEEGLEPEDEEKMSIFFAVPPETEPGIYQGYVYFFDDTSPSIPFVIDFQLAVVEQKSYGTSLSIDDAKYAFGHTKPDEPAEFELEVKNTGKFRDVISLNASILPEGWSVSLLDGEDEVELPYKVPLLSGTSRKLTLQVFGEPGDTQEIEIRATSLGQGMENDTVKALVKVGLSVRGYRVSTNLPERIVVNRTYPGTFSITLGREETILLDVVAPPELLVIPPTQIIEVAEKEAGVANFTMMATLPGKYPLVFRMVDSQGVPIPEELVWVTSEEPAEKCIVTGEQFEYVTVSSLTPTNLTLPVVTIPSGGFGQKELNEIKAYTKVIILGNASVVPSTLEETLGDEMDVQRIAGEDLGETTWLFASAMWTNGTKEIVIAAPTGLDVFKAYQLAKDLEVPLIICSSLTDKSRSIAKDMTEREIPLTRALIVGQVEEELKRTLIDMGIETEVA